MSKVFLTKIVRELKPNIANSSLTQYVSTLTQMFPDVDNESKLDSFLTKESLGTIIQNIQDKYESPSSRGLRYNSLIILLKGRYGMDDQRYIKISTLRDACNKKYLDRAEKPELSEEDTKRVVTTSEYKDFLDKWYPDIKQLMSLDKISQAKFNEIQVYHLCLVLYYYAFRRDLSPMDIIFNKSIPKDDTKNYMMVFNKRVSFVLNVYKTSKTYGQNVVDGLDKDLNSQLLGYAEYLKRKYAGKDHIPFLADKSGAYLNENMISRNFTGIFRERLDKSFTINLNRKRIVSSDPNIQQYISAKDKVEKLSKSMGTSVKMASTVYNKPENYKK